MLVSYARAFVLAAAVLVAGCNASLEDLAPKAERQLPARLVESMKARDMRPGAPIMIRIFKEESVLEVWKQKGNGRYDLATSYEICKWSGRLGPKFVEGDRQAPEGFYTVRPHQMNPRSSYHLSFNIGFPNAFDSAHGRTGQHLMVHGACSSAGCYSMTDEQVEQIYAFARDAFRGGQEAFQIQAFPFRMTAANMARYRNDPNYAFWEMLKEGYDHFEITRVPPKVDVCGRRYVFNQFPADPNGRFSATAACPPATLPDALQTAYRSYQSNFDLAFTAAIENGAGKVPPSPTIAGIQEARLVADWSRRRARGEQVPREPPTLQTAAVAQPVARPAPPASPPQAQPAAAAAQTAILAVAEGGTRPEAQPDPEAEAEAAAAPSDAAPPDTGKRNRLWGLFNR